MCIYSPMPHTLSYCALIGKCALIRSNTVSTFFVALHNRPDTVFDRILGSASFKQYLFLKKCICGDIIYSGLRGF